MRVLVTGANGFVGRHMLRELAAAGHHALALDLAAVPGHPPADTCVADLTDAARLEELVARWRPDGAIHLGGIAFVPMGWTHPQRLIDINLIGTINLLEAFRQKAAAARLVIVSSSEVYGRRLAAGPLDEDAAFRPDTPYGVSKAAADWYALMYARQYGMAAMTARPANHTGAGQAEVFAVPSFARQLALIKQGAVHPPLRVGNLESQRSIMDVRDVAHAYRVLLDHGEPGQAYNISRGDLVSMARVLEMLCDIAGVHPAIEVDPVRFRPADTVPVLDARRLRRLGWAPRHELAATLRDVFEFEWQAGEEHADD